MLSSLFTYHHEPMHLTAFFARSLRIYLLLILSSFVFALQAAWYPADVIADGQKPLYTPLAKANQAWRICALLPHGKDQYWWGVAFGLSQEAERQGVTLGIYDAGGYDKIEQQRQQLHDCYALKAQAYIIAANTADGLIADIEQLSAAGIPVIDLVNGIATDKLTSRSLVSFEDMSVAATEYIAAQQREAINQDSPKLKVAWFPGPKGASWVIAAEQGFRQAAAKQAFEIIEGGYGTTELFVQADLVRKVLAKQSVDYVIANAVAATFAARFLDGRRNQTGKVIAFYSNAQTIELVQKKQLLATVSDSPVLQARIAIDLAVRALEGAPYPHRVSPVIKVISQDNIHQIDLEQILAPENQWMIHQDLPSINGTR
ncbi:TMAO reductase system periplasmic protein TorT [Shewanella baltica]|uniref:TMAO reductase system periplasmic protein TorT n=1 Tax=Shewanella baltica TaxID=62322 RepID=UPI00321892FD